MALVLVGCAKPPDIRCCADIQGHQPAYSSNAEACMTADGRPLMDKDSGLFVACLK